MKPLKPAVKWSLAIFISAIVIAPGFNAFREDPETRRIREHNQRVDKFIKIMNK